ncbi:hypothetical protein VSDG_02150 [Cytospora chrysosperma]|uniref:Uncharacterized protein n=1 Tax=Cytospora chrysosperma TaxID=252740 RepID=A0A423WEF1_CYTCH|nr:hypothetical protein VSDG_02150 [Valsa sordida]
MAQPAEAPDELKTLSNALEVPGEEIKDGTESEEDPDGLKTLSNALKGPRDEFEDGTGRVIASVRHRNWVKAS